MLYSNIILKVLLTAILTPPPNAAANWIKEYLLSVFGRAVPCPSVPNGCKSTHSPISFSACINLVASDYLSVTVGGTGDWYAGLQETMMWGYLIG